MLAFRTTTIFVSLLANNLTAFIRMKFMEVVALVLPTLFRSVLLLYAAMLRLISSYVHDGFNGQSFKSEYAKLLVVIYSTSHKAIK